MHDPVDGISIWLPVLVGTEFICVDIYFLATSVDAVQTRRLSRSSLRLVSLAARDQA